jgi:hypothetical protein
MAHSNLLPSTVPLSFTSQIILLPCGKSTVSAEIFWESKLNEPLLSAYHLGEWIEPGSQ